MDQSGGVLQAFRLEEEFFTVHKAELFAWRVAGILTALPTLKHYPAAAGDRMMNGRLGAVQYWSNPEANDSQ